MLETTEAGTAVAKTEKADMSSERVFIDESADTRAE